MKLKKPVDLTIRIPGDKELLSLVMDASENLAAKIGFDDNKVRNIRTAVGESCANAIEHCNKNDPDKEIFLVFHVEETKLEINIFSSIITHHSVNFRVKSLISASWDKL